MADDEPLEPTSRKPCRRWLRYSLRSLLVAITAGCVVLGLWVHRAERQRQAVAAVRAAGGRVIYDYELSFDKSPVAAWAQQLLGVDYLATPVSVLFPWPHDATDAVMPQVGELDGLRKLYLDGTSVTDRGLAHLSGLRRLELLHLSRTQVGDEGVTQLSGLPNLQVLNLEQTSVTDAGVARLENMVGLKYLVVRGTQVSDAACNRLAAALPDCKIRREDRRPRTEREDEDSPDDEVM